MSSIIDESTSYKTDNKVDKNYRQHAGAERSLETFRKFTTKLDAENEQNTDQTKQRSRCAGRRHVHALEDETAEEPVCELWTHGQITCDHSGDSSHYPKHDKLCRTIKFFYEWSNHQQAVHVYQQVKEIDMDKHRRDEAPPLIVWSIDQVVELGAINLQHLLRKHGPQNCRSHTARIPHQEKDEQVCDEQHDRELVRTI